MPNGEWRMTHGGNRRNAETPKRRNHGPRTTNFRGSRFAFFAPALCLLGVVQAEGGFGAKADEPPEARRLDGAAYREGLRRRGLIDLLEAAIAESPPSNPVEADLLRREILLITYQDSARPLPEREAALAAGNDILRKLIADQPRDPQALQWRLELGRSMLFQQGEPYSVRALYFEGTADSEVGRYGGNAEDRRQLAQIMSDAIEVFDALLAAVEVEAERLDHVSLVEYERLERAGAVERLDQLPPQTAAMRRWAVFYRAVARGPRNATGVDELQSVLQEVRDQTDLLTTPHDVTHYQCQSLLLAGMAARRLGDLPKAQEYLEGALAAAERLADPMEYRDLEWVVSLTRIERVRTLRDEHQYDAAHEAIEDLRAWAGSTAPSNFGLKLATALLETSVLKSQAAAAEHDGNSALAQRLLLRSRDPLVALASQSDEYRDAVYAHVYESLDPGQPTSRMHPFDRCALIAGLIGEAQRQAKAGSPADSEVGRDDLSSEGKRTELLDRAIGVAEGLLADPASLSPEMHAEVRYNLGVARFERGHRQESAAAFLAVGRDFPTYRLAERAVTLAVQTAWELWQDPGLKQRPEVRDLYVEAITVLTEKFPKSAAAAYWQFFLAQALEELGRYADAARQYAKVAPTHEFALQARFLHSACLAQAAMELAHSAGPDRGEVVKRALEADAAAEQFVRFAAQAGESGTAAGDPAAIDRMVAKAALNRAECLVLPGVDRFADSLHILEGFEQRHAETAVLIGRVLRVRIIAYQALGQLEEAEQTIPKYLASDPAEAGATLQALFDAINQDIARLRKAGRLDQVKAKADSALLLARKLCDWSQEPAAKVPERQRYALRVQLAEAYLAASQPEQAREAFAQCTTAASSRGDGRSVGDARVTLGLAESLFALGRYAEALPLYSRLCHELEPVSEVWWRALLGDLRCRTETGQDPGGVVQVIRQHRFLHPEMGGSDLRAEFEALLQRNEEAAGRQEQGSHVPPTAPVGNAHP